MKDKKDMTMKELMEEGVSTEEAAVLFASKYDVAIKSLVEVLLNFGMTPEQYHRYLGECGEVVKRVIPNGDLPEGLTVAESGPYVEISDLTILGMLAYQWYLIGMNTDEESLDQQMNDAIRRIFGE